MFIDWESLAELLVVISMAFPFQGLTDMKIHGTNLDSKENQCSFSEEEQQEQEDSFSAEIARIIDSL